MNRLLTFVFAVTASLSLALTSISAAELEEIIVTATKKEESLQDIAVSVTVISGDKIENAGISSLQDLGQYVPNFSVTENAISTIATMRGVGVGANQSFEQSVGLFVDGIHLAKGRQFRTGLFDVERVEVLRGPQGTLFGKNTLTGALNIISAKPEIGGEFGGRIAVAAEDENSGTEIEGHINIPVADTFAIRLSFQDRENDGYINNTYNNTTGPTADEQLLRFSASWQPSDQLRFDLKHTDGEHIRIGSTVMGSVFDMAMPPTPTAGLGFLVMGNFFPGYVANIANQTYNAYADDNAGPAGGANVIGQNPYGTNTNTADTSINISYEMASGITMDIVAGAAGYDYIDGIDADYGPLVLVSRDDWSSYDQDSLEIRFSSAPGGDFSWVAGAYWDDQVQDIDRIVEINGSIGGIAPILEMMGKVPWPTLFNIPAATLNAVGVVNLLPVPFTNSKGRTYAPGAPLINNNTCDYAPFLAVATGGAFNFAPCTFQTAWDSVSRISNWTQNTDAKAIFGQVTTNLSDTVELTMGVRYVKESKHIVADVCLGGDTTGIKNCNPNPFIAGILNSAYDTWAHDFNNVPQRDTDHWLPTFSIEKRLDDQNMIYFSFDKGYKSGGFNAADDQNPAFASVNGVKTPLPNTPGIGFEYEDEVADSLEIGGKHRLADNIQFNWAIAHAEFDDQQVSTFQGTGFVVGNAASSIVDTVEIDLLWQATENLRVSLGAAYLDANYDEFTTASCTENQIAYFRALDPTGGGDGSFDPKNITKSTYGPNVVDPTGKCRIVWNDAGTYAGGNQDLSGVSLGSGKYNGSLNIDYAQPMQNDMELFVGLSYNFFDRYFMTGDLDPLDTQEANQQVNAQIGIRSGQWQAMIYGRNLTDEKIAIGGFDTPLLAGGHSIYLGETRIVGARLTYDF
jgi:outer membrane receptor protein involved in Fe transport